MNVLRLLRGGGHWIILSCNHSVDELESMFADLPQLLSVLIDERDEQHAASAHSCGSDSEVEALVNGWQLDLVKDDSRVVSNQDLCCATFCKRKRCRAS